jgi:hypothetical protein
MKAVPAGPLIQIRRGYATAWHECGLTVEIDEAGWTVQVRDRDSGAALYSGRRCSFVAAKVAATEYALSRTSAPAVRSPEALAQLLTWTEYW